MAYQSEIGKRQNEFSDKCGRAQKNNITLYSPYTIRYTNLLSPKISNDPMLIIYQTWLSYKIKGSFASYKDRNKVTNFDEPVIRMPNMKGSPIKM